MVGKSKRMTMSCQTRHPTHMKYVSTFVMQTVDTVLVFAVN